MTDLKIMEIPAHPGRVHFFPTDFKDKAEAPWKTEIDSEDRVLDVTKTGIRGKSTWQISGFFERIVHWCRVNLFKSIVDVTIGNETYALNVHSAANYLERVGCRLRTRDPENVRKWVQLFAKGPEEFILRDLKRNAQDGADVNLYEIRAWTGRVATALKEYYKADREGVPQFFMQLAQMQKQQ